MYVYYIISTWCCIVVNRVGQVHCIHTMLTHEQGDTLQNVAKELDKVLETGYYSFKLPTDGEAQMILEYVPSTSQTSNTFEEGVDGGTTVRSRASSSHTSKLEPQTSDLERGISKRSKPEQWNSEQIGDFVRKLGFMDTEREGGEKIKHFRHISSVSTILYNGDNYIHVRILYTCPYIICVFFSCIHVVNFIPDCLPSTGVVRTTEGPRKPSLFQGHSGATLLWYRPYQCRRSSERNGG